MPRLGISTYLKLGLGLGVIIALGLLYTMWQSAEDRSDGWEAKYDEAVGHLGQMLGALRIASGNQELQLEGATGQIYALGDSNRRIRIELDETNQTVLAMAEEAVALKARAEKLQQIAERAERERDQALSELRSEALTPGTRDNLVKLVEEAEAALDLVRETGL